MRLRPLAERPGGLALALPPMGTNHTLRYCTSFAGCDDVAPVSKSLECDSMRLDRPRTKVLYIIVAAIGQAKSFAWID
jgi:hypothetical protein